MIIISNDYNGFATRFADFLQNLNGNLDISILDNNTFAAKDAMSRTHLLPQILLLYLAKQLRLYITKISLKAVSSHNLNQTHVYYMKLVI